MNKNIIIIAIIVLILAAIGIGFWFFLKQAVSPGEMPPVIFIPAREKSGINGDTASAINQELNSADIGDLDAEFKDIDAELKNL